MADRSLEVKITVRDEASGVIERLIYDEATDVRQLRNLVGTTRLRVNGRDHVASDYAGLVVPGGVPVLEALFALGHRILVEKPLTRGSVEVYDGHIGTNDDKENQNAQA